MAIHDDHGDDVPPKMGVLLSVYVVWLWISATDECVLQGDCTPFIHSLYFESTHQVNVQVLMTVG